MFFSSNTFGLSALHVRCVKNTGINNSYEHWCDDLCIGLWINKLKKEIPIIQIDNKLFHVGLHDHESDLQTAITIHKVMNKEQYEFYSSIKDDELKIDHLI